MTGPKSAREKHLKALQWTRLLQLVFGYMETVRFQAQITTSNEVVGIQAGKLGTQFFGLFQVAHGAWKPMYLYMVDEGLGGSCWVLLYQNCSPNQWGNTFV